MFNKLMADFLSVFRKEKPVAKTPYVRKTPRTKPIAGASFSRDNTLTKSARSGLSAHADQNITAEIIAKVGVSTEESEIAMMEQFDQPHLSFEPSHVKSHIEPQVTHHSCSDNLTSGHSHHHDVSSYSASDSSYCSDTSSYTDTSSY